MALKKTLMIAGAVTSIGLAGATTAAHMVSAESNDSTAPMSGLVSKIAEKFNLNEGDVQEVFEEHRTEIEAGHDAEIEVRLDEAVQNGKITAEQKTAIMAKLDELKAERETDRETFRDMTPEERHEAMKQRREALQQWAEDNGIPEDLLRSFGPIRIHRGPGMGEKILREDGF